MAFASINGLNVHYELIGTPRAKKLVVFSNALGCDFRIWLPLFDAFDDDVSVLLYDTRGHGLTEAGDGAFGVDDLADDLIGLVEHVGIRKAVFCGLSMGGLVVQALYAKRPELVAGLILSNTATKVGTAETWNGRIAQTLETGIASFSDAIMDRWFTPAFHEERAAELRGYRTMAERQNAAAYAAACAAIRDADYTAAASAIAVPVLVIAGDADASVSPDVVEATAGRIPGAVFEVIEGCGHIPCVEQPDVMADLIAGFLTKTAGERPAGQHASGRGRPRG